LFLAHAKLVAHGSSDYGRGGTVEDQEGTGLIES
jgi:hypothetical protein